MLPRAQRLSGDQVQELLSQRTAVFHTTFFMVRVLARNDSNPSRFSIITSKKVAKLAVQRNLLRRRVFSIISKLPIPVGRDYVISVKQTASYSQYFTDLQNNIQHF